MKIFLFILVFFSFTAMVRPQDPERDKGADQVRAAVKGFGYQPKAVRVILRNLVELRGKAIAATDDSFDLKAKGNRVIVRRVRYRDVLTFEGGGTSLNFIPEKSQQPYGDWVDVKKVYSATRIAIALTDGKIVKGWFNSATDSHLVLTERTSNARLDVPREQIVAIYGLLGGRGGAKWGASKGGEIPGPLGSGQRDPLAAGVGAGIGAIIGTLIKDDGTPVLVFFK